MQTAPSASLVASSPGLRLELGFLLVAGLLSAFWCVTSARELSATYDEPVYVQEGLTRWRTGSTAGLMKLGTMPLPVDVQTLPLYLWEAASGVAIDPEADWEKILPLARACTLVFWWLLLVHVWLIGRSLAGPWAGLTAAAFLSCEPSLVAHAALATTDVALTSCLVALLYHFMRNRDRGWWRRVAWPGLWFGIAILAKVSGLVFGCLCLFVLEGFRCSWWRGKDGPTFRQSFRDLRQIGYIGLALVFVYCGSDWETEPSFVRWAHALPEGTFGSVMVWLSENLRIFSNAGEGILKQFSHNVRGHGTYLLGVTHKRSLWYYFPVLLTIKLTLPLLAATLLLGGRRLLARDWRGNWPLQAAMALFLFSPLCRVQIGIRFMFPLIALLVTGLAVTLVQTVLATPSLARRRVLACAGTACLGWTAGALVAVWPHGICYVNPLWGGTDAGYGLVSDGNYDWGQGLKELVRWQEKHALPDLDVWAFSTDPMIRRLPMRSVRLHELPLTSAEDMLDHFRGRQLAVGVTFLHGPYFGGSFDVVREALKHRRPVARTTTYLIYDFADESGPAGVANSRPAGPGGELDGTSPASYDDAVRVERK